MAPLPGMLRYNTDTSIFERSTDEGANWVPLSLSFSGDFSVDPPLFVVDTTNDIIGIGTVPVALDFTKLQIDSFLDNLRLGKFSNDVFGASIIHRKSRSGTVGVNTVVTNGDVLGTSEYHGYDGTSYTIGASILAKTNGAISAGVVPTDLLFRTLDAAGNFLERLRISASSTTSVLNIDGGATVSSQIRFNQNGTNRAFIYYDNANAILSISRSGGSATGINISSTDKIGIGNAAPLKTLHVGVGSDTPADGNDGIYIARDGDCAIVLRNCTANVEGVVDVSATEVLMGAITNHPLKIYAGGAERMGITTAGVVRFNNYTATTFVAGDKYLVVDASGNIHRSAIGPAS